jgi:subtilase family serine protease
MIRRYTTSFLTTLALGSVLNIVCPAQAASPITRHVPDAVLNGQAQRVGSLPASQPMRIVLVLPLRNEPALQRSLQEIYDPSSLSYHQFLTVDQFTSLYGPTEEDYNAVTNFAQSKGLAVAATSRNRLNLDVTGPVANIEAALHVNMAVYRHPIEDRTFYSADREPTPDLSIPLWHIAGLDNYSIPQPLISRRPPGVQPAATTGSCPSQSFCGSDMRAAYYGGSLTGTGQSLGLLEYLGTDLADLNTYYTNAGQTNKVPITLLSTDGTSTSCLKADGCDDTEQTIDMTQALGMAPGLSSLVMYVGSSDSAIFNAMATADPLNAQLSSSWTWSPADPSTDDPYFMEFALQGQNLFQASGDSGKWGAGSHVFPADDPNLTAVGGTDLTTASAGGPWSSETAWSNGGGGISPDKFAIPYWQVPAAAGCAKCSQTYRNDPDVAANANYSFYVCADQTTCTANDYGGTSFAAPMWAGYLALVNEQAAMKAQKPLGFINPTIYAIGASSNYDANFHDITGGSNGYSATVGYDLATGWGSPNGGALIGTLTGSVTPGFTISASPIPVSVLQGSSGSSTITSTVIGGFDSKVSLSATGQPTGVTVGFSPTSITGNGSSTMSIGVAASTSEGTYMILVTGTSGSATSSAAILLTVTGTTPDFTIVGQPRSVSLQPGGRGHIQVTTTVSNGFDSAIALSASGGNGALTFSFSPATIAAPGAGTSTMTIDVSNKAPVANHQITITGTGGGVTHTATITLKVN